MFCRFCGKDILDDSEFCSYCGKLLLPEDDINANQEQASMHNNVKFKTMIKENKMLSVGFANATKAVCYVSLVVFLLCLFKMAPGFGTTHIVSYIGIAIVAIALVILFDIFEYKARNNNNKTYFVIALIVAACVLIFTVALRIVYEAKVDEAVANIPDNGNVYVRVNLDKAFYSLNTGKVKNPRAHIRIGDTWYESSDIAYVKLNQSYPLRVGTGYDHAGGYIDTTIIFEPDSLRGGYTQVEDVKITATVVGEVTMEFTRELDFWSVIFY